MLRRTFVLSGVMTGSRRSASAQSDPIGMALRKSLEQRRIPAAVAMVATQKEVVFRAAFGKRDPSGPDVDPEAIFRIASMTKPITTVAALQLVERGKLSLDEPVARHLPRLANLDVLEGFDPSGKPSLRPAKTEITLRHLLTHTSGLGYDTWDQRMYEFTQRAGETYPKPGPLMFEPGTRWQYGQGIDWAGRLVEALAGSTLDSPASANARHELRSSRSQVPATHYQRAEKP
jgi:methyl acetate hydrolase